MRARLALVLALAVWATVPRPAAADEPVLEPRPAPLEHLTFEQAESLHGLFWVWDPGEPANRRLYWFNAQADDYVLLPAVRGYEWAFPRLVRKGIENVFLNFYELTTLANSILQLQPRKTGVTLTRFVVNTTVGVAGLWDPATRLGLHRYDEDFGQTLGYWGVPAGPYFVIPLLGPSSVRDAFGEAVDRVPLFIFGIPPFWVTPVETVNTRANNSFRYGEIGGAFEYDTVRFLATERRKLQIAQ